MSHYCNICCIHMKSKRNYDRHCKTARHKSREELKANNTVEIQHVCTCGKIFTKQPNLSRHRKTCEIHKNRNTKKETEVKAEDEDEEIKKQLEEERQIHEQEIKHRDEKMEELQEEIERLKAEKSVINNNQNIETQNNINIHLNAYGKENLDYITDTVMLRCINHITRSIPMLVSKIHFDPKHPENHNIKITNHRLPYVKILNKKKKWEYANREQTMVNVICKSYSMLETTYEGYKDEIPESTQKHFENFQNKYNENDDKTMKNLNQHVEMIMMNGH